MADILVVGSCVMDLTAIVDEFPRDGETLLANSFYGIPGGKGFNQAVAAYRLGADVEMIGSIGQDHFGQEFLKTFEKDKIKHDHFFINQDLFTGMAQIQINKEHQNRIVVISGANSALTVDKVDLFDEAIQASKVVMVQLEIPLETSKEILKRAKKYGKITIVNTAPAREVDEEFLSYCDYVTPNDVEVGALAGIEITDLESVKKAARIVFTKGPKHVIVTIGKEGAYLFDDKHDEIIPSYKVKAVDTVCAGDSFNGAFATRLLETNDIIESIKFATAEGALTVTRKGAISSLHTREELDEFLRTGVVL